jgi:hypothetical protein
MAYTTEQPHAMKAMKPMYFRFDGGVRPYVRSQPRTKKNAASSSGGPSFFQINAG